LYEPITQRNEAQRFETITIGSENNPILLDHGRTYIVLDKGKGFQIATDLLFLGSELLCISHSHPDLVRERWYGKRTQYICLCERPEGIGIAPDQLSRLGSRIYDFVAGRSDAVVMLEGIEFLTAHNDFNRVQMFVEHLNDIAMETGSIMIIQTDPRSFDQRSLARLSRFAEMVV
jgi:hypothetical protein